MGDKLVMKIGDLVRVKILQRSLIGIVMEISPHRSIIHGDYGVKIFMKGAYLHYPMRALVVIR